MKIITVIGARPQFIKAACISRLRPSIVKEIIIHTGQHYDDNMSTVFFKQLHIPEPDYYLNVGSGTHGTQTARMIEGIEKILFNEEPDIVLVYGDTNSTLAGSLAASKLHIPIAHVESGLRSFNKKMPEEINRVITDHLSSLLFCPTHTALDNLKKEGIVSNVHLVGDIMHDSVLYYKTKAHKQSDILTRLNLSAKKFYLTTVHRAENTDDPNRLTSILKTISQLDHDVVFPLHPRTKKQIEKHQLHIYLSSPHIKVTDPLNYLDMLMLESEAKMILTDSGGVQKEAYLFKVPCITLRDETEWIETVTEGWNHVTGVNTQLILNTIDQFKLPPKHPALFGNGRSAEKICQILLEFLKSIKKK
ncbi:UDP-N-acetylglucosamine 2-epimerase [Evansella vedderi]|uniref:UDP-N-acetylglucosamine 2-epimerase n=1 Tax=Evansella vedderi TaxID=38282 RepID=A0ABT9ZVT6_9BACI|nr:UDP-N-acetylglucosamine 2-epimerase (non-hydrolyzing) [Evansella vedderi]MDQ0255343.1 UDP-N-acetylglucosamine 2-epimerase [Evansella vedderi]